MNEAKKNKLSREEQARIEIGHTEVSRGGQWTLTLLFMALVTIYPLCQFCTHNPFAQWRQKGTLRASIKAYETAIEDTSLLRQWLLTPVQRFLTGCLHTGNEKVIIGKQGQLFFAGDCEYLFNPGFLRPEIQQRRSLSGVQPDPVKAIVDFNRQLQARGIQLILLPVPVKPVIYADLPGGKDFPAQNPSFAEFAARIKEAGIIVIDLAADFAEMRHSGTEPYLKTDTHWTPEAMEFAAAKTAAVMGGKSLNTACPAHEVTNLGDTAVMLNLPDCSDYFPAETVSVRDYNCRPQIDSEVLLLGDSFANIYAAKAMKWGENGGLAEALGACLGKPVDAILRNDAGAYATRQLLANELKRGRDRLQGKKFVVYEFAVRELANGDWKLLDMTLGQTPEKKLLNVTTPQEVTATVLGVSPVPRPHTAPYKDHIMSLHLGDINGGTEQALVYCVSMRDNCWTAAANLRLGDSIKIRVEPWEKREVEYGSWNRSEFEEEELTL